MRLVCPGCGLIASAEAWVSDPQAREVMARVVKLPLPIPVAAFPYLSLFRGETGRALSWQRTMRLVTELETLVARGYVSVQGQTIDRDCPPSIWAMGMEQMAERRDSLRRPLKNHNYLRQVVYDLAEKADKGSEARVVRGEVKRPNLIRQAAPKSPLDAWVQGERDDKPTDEEMAAWKRQQYAEPRRGDDSQAANEGIAKINSLIKGVCNAS